MLNIDQTANNLVVNSTKPSSKPDSAPAPGAVAKIMQCAPVVALTAGQLDFYNRIKDLIANQKSRQSICVYTYLVPASSVSIDKESDSKAAIWHLCYVDKAIWGFVTERGISYLKVRETDLVEDELKGIDWYTTANPNRPLGCPYKMSSPTSTPVLVKAPQPSEPPPPRSPIAKVQPIKPVQPIKSIAALTPGQMEFYTKIKDLIAKQKRSEIIRVYSLLGPSSVYTNQEDCKVAVWYLCYVEKSIWGFLPERGHD